MVSYWGPGRWCWAHPPSSKLRSNSQCQAKKSSFCEHFAFCNRVKLKVSAVLYVVFFCSYILHILIRRGVPLGTWEQVIGSQESVVLQRHRATKPVNPLIIFFLLQDSACMRATRGGVGRLQRQHAKSF